MTERRKLPPLGTTKIVDGVTFTATRRVDHPNLSPDNWIVWDGGPRGGQITEQAAKTVTGTAAFTGETVHTKLPRFRMLKGSDDCGEAFPPLARASIRAQRKVYEKAKTLVEAFEGREAA